MKKFAVVLLVLVVAGAAYGWYFLYGPLEGIKRRNPEETAPVQAKAPEPEKAREYISVEPAKELIDGFPTNITVQDGEKTYATQYTGQFRRIKKIAFVDVKTYDIASYVVEPKKGETFDLLDGLLVDGPVKVYMLRFISRLPGRQIMNDIYHEINTTFTDVDVDRLADNIDRFCEQFSPGSKKGDVVILVWLPGGRIYSCFNTMEKVHFIGQDVPFARAIWRIWAGPQRGPDRVKLVSQFAEPALK